MKKSELSFKYVRNKMTYFHSFEREVTLKLLLDNKAEYEIIPLCPWDPFGVGFLLFYFQEGIAHIPYVYASKQERTIASHCFTLFQSEDIEKFEEVIRYFQKRIEILLNGTESKAVKFPYVNEENGWNGFESNMIENKQIMQAIYKIDPENGWDDVSSGECYVLDENMKNTLIEYYKSRIEVLDFALKKQRIRKIFING